jgi:hypothetical protein
MGAHGGFMDRSASRFATFAGAAVIGGMLLAGCGSTPGGAVLGVSHPATSAPAPASGNALAGLEKAITAELDAVNDTLTDSEPSPILIELNALNSPSSLVRAENFAALQASGAKEIAKREQLIDGLASDVEGDGYLSGVDVAGASLRRSLMSILEGANRQLTALATRIATDSLPDVLRSDVISINASTRVNGVVEPLTHLALAGGDELSEINGLAAQEEQRASQISSGAATDPNYSREVAYLHYLTGNIAAARQTANAAENSVLGLTPSEFPGTKTIIATARTQLTLLRASSGALTVAENDLAEIVTLLGDR